MAFASIAPRSVAPRGLRVYCAKGFGKTQPKKSSAPRPKTALQRETCPCGSGRRYEECCESYHLGAAPATIEDTLRSRFSAYVKGRPDYLVKTTHADYHKFTYGTEPGGAQAKLIDDIFVACKISTYYDLQVLSQEQVSDEEGYITFSYTSIPKKTPGVADQSPKWLEKFGAGGDKEAASDEPRSTTERSKFLKDDGYWKFAEYSILQSTDPEVPVPAASKQ